MSPINLSGLLTHHGHQRGGLTAIIEYGPDADADPHRTQQPPSPLCARARRPTHHPRPPTPA
ncbi:hypothetical protein [Streptomyces amritsarensis]|uniref:hypothetical protein n=1 Tax=Streptomyces amritsarensis TaxID=681158 RepID=UPI0036C57121